MKTAECRKIDAFELWYWRRLFRVPWTARRSNQSILKDPGSQASSRGEAKASALLSSRDASFRMDWLGLFAVQGTLKSLLQHHSSKASIFRHSAFFTVQLLPPFMTTGKTITFSRRTFVGKVISLLFNRLSSNKCFNIVFYLENDLAIHRLPTLS